jgi:transposase
MMGRQTVDQSQLFYLFNLEKRIPERHLLRRINPIVGRILAEFRRKLAPFYGEIGRPSIDPELMIRMLIVGYCYGIRFERRLCEEVELRVACHMAAPLGDYFFSELPTVITGLMHRSKRLLLDHLVGAGE